ncbi:MAG: hypothetical protein LBF12_00890 [Christensenellaceae bacterium]|jgi:rubrerythrin|nr:hypothetical protein [Christensenellaceae bacterium]
MPIHAFLDFFERARSINAELFDEQGNSVPLTDASLQGNLLQSAILFEWETIRTYEAFLDSFAGVSKEILNDIITDEKVHICQFLSMLDNIGKPATNDIEVRMAEGEAQLARSDVVASCAGDMQRNRPINRIAQTNSFVNRDAGSHYEYERDHYPRQAHRDRNDSRDRERTTRIEDLKRCHAMKHQFVMREDFEPMESIEVKRRPRG